jgi:hypothetical protein
MPLWYCAAFDSLGQGIIQAVFHVVYFVARCP